MKLIGPYLVCSDYKEPGQFVISCIHNNNYWGHPITKENKHPGMGHMHVIPILGGLKQKNCEAEPNLGNLMRKNLRM